MKAPTNMTSTAGKKYLAERAVSVEESIRTRMLKLASRMDDVIPLGRGDPDFDTPELIVKEGVRALEQGMHHYTVPAGIPELRQAVCDKLRQDNDLDYSPDQVIICNGCQEAVFLSILALVNPGDEVILQAPRFNAFDYMVNLAGGRVVTVPTKQEDDFALKANAIRQAITDKTSYLWWPIPTILPAHSPSGTIC